MRNSGKNDSTTIRCLAPLATRKPESDLTAHAHPVKTLRLVDRLLTLLSRKPKSLTNTGPDNMKGTRPTGATRECVDLYRKFWREIDRDAYRFTSRRSHSSLMIRRSLLYTRVCYSVKHLQFQFLILMFHDAPRQAFSHKPFQEIRAIAAPYAETAFLWVLPDRCA